MVKYERAKTMYIDAILAPRGAEAAGLLHV